MLPRGQRSVGERSRGKTSGGHRREQARKATNKNATMPFVEESRRSAEGTPGPSTLSKWRKKAVRGIWGGTDVANTNGARLQRRHG